MVDPHMPAVGGVPAVRLSGCASLPGVHGGPGAGGFVPCPLGEAVAAAVPVPAGVVTDGGSAAKKESTEHAGAGHGADTFPCAMAAGGFADFVGGGNMLVAVDDASDLMVGDAAAGRAASPKAFDLDRVDFG